MEKIDVDTVKIGIIGIGNMGSAHAKNIYNGNVKGMELAAVCDIKTESLEWVRNNLSDNIKVYKDYEKMMNDKVVEAVIIATPHNLHPIIARKYLENGYHVLSEKPIGIDTQTVRKLNEFALECDLKFCVMYNQRTNPLFQKLKEIIVDGRIGKVKRFVWIITNWYRSQAYYNSGEWRATWNGEGGGVLLNQCPHNLDIWYWLFGMPKRIRAFCRYGQYHSINVEDDATIYAEYENGMNVTFITSTGESPGTNRIEISGTKGKIIVENGELHFYKLFEDERNICYNTEENGPRIPYEEEVICNTETRDGHILILENFANAILYDDELLSPGVEGIKGLMISNAAYLSQWLDDWVELPIDEEMFLDFFNKLKSEEDVHDKGKEKSKLEGEYCKRWEINW